MALITIGAVALPNPKEYGVTLSDLDSDSTTRSETGILHRDRVRARVYTIQVSFLVTRAQLKTITDAISPVSFSVTFFDPTSSTDVTKTMYAGDKASKLALYPSESAPTVNMWDISFTLIEF